DPGIAPNQQQQCKTPGTKIDLLGLAGEGLERRDLRQAQMKAEPIRERTVVDAGDEALFRWPAAAGAQSLRNGQSFIKPNHRSFSWRRRLGAKRGAWSIAPAISSPNQRIVLAPTILLYNRLRLGLNASHAALATHNACAHWWLSGGTNKGDGTCT